MITENYIHSEGRRFDVPIKRKRTKSNVKVGGIYWCSVKPFQGKIRAECLTIYDNSALVKIIVCEKEADEALQVQLNHLTVVSFKNMKGV